MDGKIKEYDKIKYSDKDLWWATTKVAIMCFVVLGIYFRFLVVEKTQQDIKEVQDNGVIEFQQKIDGIVYDLTEKNTETNRRIDTKTDRNKGYIDKNTKDIETLKLPNTDNE